MAQVGVVKSLDGGVFYAKDSSGNIRELSIGDSISENEIVFGDNSNQISAKVEMELSGNDIIVLNQAQQQLIDSSLNEVTFGNEEVIFTKGDINTTFENADLSAWNNTTDDVSDDMETAAGDPTQQETQAGEEEPTEEGRVAARFSTRDGSSTNVVSDLRDTVDFGTQSTENDNDNEIPTELLNPQTSTTTEPTTPTEPIDTRVEASKITLSNPTIKEGKDITITATVENAPQTDLIITLKNGEKIIIKAGETTGTTTFTNPNGEDVYKDSSTETYTISGTEGGNYKELDISDKSTVTIVDTEDTVTVVLSATKSTSEDGGSIVYTATLTNKDGLPVTAKEAVTVTLENGETIIIPVGGTTADSDPVAVNRDDVYKETDSISNAIKTVSGGESFEDLQANKSTVVTTIEDDKDTVYVDVTASSTSLIEGDKVTYKVTLRNQDGLEVKNHGGLNITLSNGLKINIPANETSGTAKGIATVGSNTIKVQTIVETATDGSGKKFEDIQPGKTVTVNANSASLKNYTKTATEDGSENVASEDSLDTINGKDDGLNVSDTLKNSQNKSITISKVVFEGTSYDVKSSFTTIKGKYGTLEIKSNGEYKYTVDNENPDVDALNVGDKLADNFEYVVKSGKDELKAVLTIEVEGRNDAPIIENITTNDVTLTGVYNDYQKDNITENITAKDLIAKDGANSYQFKNENNTLKINLGETNTDIGVKYEGKNAAWENILGYYEIDENGNPSNFKILMVNGVDEATKTLEAKVGEVGFFLISTNGANGGKITQEMKNMLKSDYTISKNLDGTLTFTAGKSSITSKYVYYTDEQYSTDKDRPDHVIALKSKDANSLIIAFEDQDGKSTDFDYNDFVITVTFTPTESLSNKLFKNVDFSDVDDVNLSEATVTLANATADDKINIAGDLKEGISYTTDYKNGKLVVKFTGIASHDAYEEAIEAIRFTTKNSEDERKLNFEIEIKDPSGKTDKSSVIINAKGFGNDAPTIENENVQTKEDTPYIFSIEDFASYSDKNSDSIETIKIVTLPDSTKGVLKYDGEIITAGKEILVKYLGKLVFEPALDSDKDASFTFQVSDSRGAYSDIKTMTVGVEAVADAPTVTISIEKSVDTSSSENSGYKEDANIWAIKDKELKILNATEPTGNNINGEQYTGDQQNNTVKFSHLNNGNVDLKDGNDYFYSSQNAKVTLNLGNGDNQAHFNADMEGKVIGLEGNDTLIINSSVKNNAVIDLGDGDNTISIGTTFNGNITTGTGNDTIIIGSNINNTNAKIITGAGNDFVQIHGEINNQFGKVDLGEGNDGFRYTPNSWNAGNENAIDGGKGFDTLYLKGNHSAYKVYTKDSSIVGATAWLDNNGYPVKSNDDKALYTISWENFAKANEDSNGYAQKEFYIMQNNTADINRALKVTNFESVSFDDKTFGEKADTTAVYKYDISLSAQLTDTDGSEKLSDITLKNIPEGSKLFGPDGKEIDANDNGTYTVNVDAKGEAKLSLTNEKEVSDTDLNSIKASATSTENSNDDSATTTVSQNLGHDIDLSGLTSILEEQKTGDIDLSKNGSQDKLTLTLDDVLKLKGDDEGLIKISGDAFDSVSFKDTINEDGSKNSWSKTEGTGDDKGYDIYVNSGDSTLQVKVEQPISDGITN
ncbi:VCBS domain-containing protein [Aliarcobacter butzleri]|uniref:immunoglobulin-like domain-containing protein n=1 Tax=Aliarcobacter butzleri TaxID=28197 RepID=UPI0021B21D13|nr:immunoglobulin-like domain-containing protein [Aliarcobacter butzleri]MCT7552914.1 VCBS domain-containing protein [Aliarcobacter butzleri]MCT7584879.1 VCBS domain-containing protein [Aliarcobacter butzleri]